MITPSNGFLDGSGISPFGSHEDHKHNTVNQSASTAANIAGIVADFNALLAKLKNAGSDGERCVQPYTVEGT